MAIYVLLSSLTPEGGQTLHSHPERLAEVNKEINNFGCKVVAQYALLGQYDFLTIVEAADNETVAPPLGGSRFTGHGPHHDAAGHPGGLIGAEVG